MIRRLLRFVLMLVVASIVLAAGAWLWLWHTESGARWAWETATAQVAGLERGSKLDGSISGTLGGQLRYRNVRYEDKDVAVEAEQVLAAASLNLFPIAVQVHDLSLAGVTLRLAESQPDEEPSSLEDLGSIDSPYAIAVDHFLVERFTFIRGEIRETVDIIEGRLSWHDALDVEISHLESHLLAGSLSLESELAQPFRLQAQVSVERFTAPEPMQEQMPWVPATLDADATISGSLQGLDISGELAWPEWMPGGGFEGRVLPLDGWSWGLDLDLPVVRLPERWIEESIGAPDSGVDGNVLLENFTVHGEGRDDAWSLQGESEISASWLESDAIAFGLSGAASGLDQWMLSGGLLVSASGWPSGLLNIEASGAGEDIQATLHAPELFGGSLLISGESQPGDNRPWTGSAEIGNLALRPALEALAPHLGDDLTGQLEATIDLLEAETLTASVVADGALEPFNAIADIRNLSTGIQGREMQVKGRLEFDETRVRTPGMTVLSGDSSLRASGALNDDAGMALDVQIANLDDFFPGTFGSLSGWVRYRHDPRGLAESRFRASLHGENIAAHDWRVGRLDISEPDAAATARYRIFGTTDPDPPLAVAVEAADISGSAGIFDTVSASLIGRLDNLGLALTTRTRETDIFAELDAASIDDAPGAWRGTLHNLTLHPPQGLDWTLDAPAGYHFADGARLEPACFAANETAGICIDFTQQPDGAERGQLTLSNLSPEVFSAMSDWPADFSQQLSGILGWTRSADSGLSAEADLDITPGVVTDRSTGAELLESGPGELSFRIEENSLVAGALDIPLDAGMIDVDFALPDLLQDSETSLNGRIRVDLESLEALSAFIPNVAQVAGELAVDLVVGGTPASPKFSGTTALRNGRFRLPGTGFSLSDIDIDGQLERETQLLLKGTFMAGEGPGAIDARLDISDPLTPRLDARLTGQSMTLMNVPDVQLQANTDIRFGWAGDRVDLLGTVHVPAARFAPRYLPSETASESSDVVLMSNGKPIHDEKKAASDWKIFGDLAVSLGDNVVIDLELARAKATGAAMFSWRGNTLPVANGEYSIRGDIQAYGQSLEITKAAVRFPNVPADSPYLDVRAERTIYGNSLVNKAGVLVNGTLKRPQAEPYTVPPTNADRARALLITGSDFDYEQGVGAVNVGTYIAPKLYLSYGVGLFEEGNVITARYELRRNFGVRATSGQDETGIDFTYTIEK